jgi:NAD(P)-dependent dehydrogenase (short-subunit alcohol dehydrogenase family)
MPRLEGKVAVVFGAARGIGREIVRQFVAEGAFVHAADLLPLEPGTEPESSLRSAIVDASDPEPVAAFLDSVMAHSGYVDVLVNNAGIHLPKSVVESTPEEFDRIFAVNVKPAYLACRYLLPSMLERGRGSIINTSSNGGIMGRPADPLYNASKHAIIGLTKSLAVAYAQQGIRVNAVCPGAIDTPMLRASVSGSVSPEDVVRRAVASAPMARVAHASEVAAAVVFLASDESPFINGVALPIDGAKSAGQLTADRYRTDFTINTSYD